MGLLKSINNVPGIDYYDYRDDDYYGKYKYRVRFCLAGIRYAAYEKNVEGLMKRYNATAGWRVIRKEDRDVVTDNLEHLKQFIEFRNSLKENGTGLTRVEYQKIAFFSNDLGLLKTAESIKPGLYYDYTQVQTTNFVGVKSFMKEPKHKFRVYLRSRKVDNDFSKNLSSLLKRTPDLYPSPSLAYWLQSQTNGTNPHWSWKYRYTNPAHFIDYDDESTLSYIGLMYSEYLGKRYKLEKRPDPI